MSRTDKVASVFPIIKSAFKEKTQQTLALKEKISYISALDWQTH